MGVIFPQNARDSVAEALFSPEAVLAFDEAGRSWYVWCCLEGDGVDWGVVKVIQEEQQYHVDMVKKANLFTDSTCPAPKGWGQRAKLRSRWPCRCLLGRSAWQGLKAKCLMLCNPFANCKNIEDRGTCCHACWRLLEIGLQSFSPEMGSSGVTD
jgi:hypothetical protein